MRGRMRDGAGNVPVLQDLLLLLFLTWDGNGFVSCQVDPGKERLKEDLQMNASVSR